jgi:hypothetical protein
VACHGILNRFSPLFAISLLFRLLQAKTDSIPSAWPHPPQTPTAPFKPLYPKRQTQDHPIAGCCARAL